MKKQFIRYLIAATVGYCVDIATLFILKEMFFVHYLIAAIIGFIMGLIVVYYLSNRYVFGKSKLASKKMEFSIFSIIGLIGLGILTLFMWLLTDILHMNYILAKIWATVIVYIWNFLARRNLYSS